MQKILHLTAVFLLCFFFSSCEKYLGDPANPTVYDQDAQRFFDSSGITDISERFAINNFVTQLKDSALWAEFSAIYPLVGGSEASVKWNLKDPRDLDAAYRLTFTGSPVYATTGVLFPTISDHADTHLADSAMGGYSDASISYYSRTQNTVSGYDMGCTDGGVPYNELSIYSAPGDNSEWFGFSQNILSPNTTGLFTLSSSATDVTRYRNGIVISSKGSPPVNNYTNLTILLGTSRVTAHAGQRECALAAIGRGLTGAQALTFYDIVQKLETALSR